MLDGLSPGDTLPRPEVHLRYGGRFQGTIAGSSKLPVVLFFTDPRAARYGYREGWDRDDLFHLVGEGQSGTQRLVQNNKSLTEHATTGRSLEGFEAVEGDMVRYLGEFALVDTCRVDLQAAMPDAPVREGFIFRLRQIGKGESAVPHTQITPSATAQVSTVSLETHHCEAETEQIVTALVAGYASELRRQGHEVSRLRVVPAQEVRPTYSDLWDDTDRAVIVAADSATREKIRCLIGRLADLGRAAKDARRVALLPDEPRSDLLDLLLEVGVEIVFPADRTDGRAGWTRWTP